MRLPKGLHILLKLLYHVVIGVLGFMVVGAGAAALYFLEQYAAALQLLPTEILFCFKWAAIIIAICDIFGLLLVVIWELCDLVWSITQK